MGGIEKHYCTLYHDTGQNKIWTADYGLGIKYGLGILKARTGRYGLGIKHGLGIRRGLDIKYGLPIPLVKMVLIGSK